MLKMGELVLFVAVVEAQSITGGAEKLGLPKSNISRRMKQLEESLGVKLIDRTPRVFKLTDPGLAFYQGAIDLLQSAEALTQQVTRQQALPSGRLRICGPSALTHLILRKSLRGFTEHYPDIQLEFLSGAHKRSMYEENIDLLITINRPKDSSLIATSLMQVGLGFYASPDYLKQHAAPDKPEQLSQHSCIGSLNQNLEKMPWRYAASGKLKTLDLTPRYYSDSGSISRDMAELGLGVALLPHFICEEAVKQGKLVTLFDGKYGPVDQIYALYSSRKHLPAKTRLFLDHLKQTYPGIV
jgi:DNA-binding transcriptional LysR family regulator